MLLPRADHAQKPESDRARVALGLGVGEARQGLVEEDHDGLLWRAPGERVVDGIAPELHAQVADGRVRHELGEAHELEVERAKGVVGVSSRWRYEVPDQEGIEVGLSSTFSL